ncbi:MAG TPA: 16S rRNA (uracil(1498)-N(3))-methyltransferase [Vicinamibacteria bacterium]|nr:16S rRNA (uracil(1498)-N(3))-methyltransferase [Vicinamibacteria bacterium]
MSSPPRFHVPEAAPGARVTLPEHSAHHAREVLRLRSGHPVRIFDGAGQEFEAILDVVRRGEVSARLSGLVPARPESPLELILALSPLKGDRMELVIQKATELGVTAFRPVVTARTDAAARPALKGSRQDRWDKVASGAAEQCGRAVVPEVAPACTLAQLLVETPGGPLRLLLDETPGQPSLSTLTRPPGAVLALVGPAGGWEPHELERLQSAGFRRVSLGPRVLRAETAAIALVAALQLLWGDLGPLSPRLEGR